MSRLIEFRGLATNGEFVYGSLVNNCAGLPNGVGQNTKTWIVTSAFGNGGWFNIRGRQYVRPETVGQFTGRLDINGSGLLKVFEGDIIDIDGKIIGSVHEIQPRDTDLVIPRMGTKAWGLAYKEAMERGFDFAE